MNSCHGKLAQPCKLSMHTHIAGAGFSGFQIAKQALAHGTVSATRRTTDALTALQALGVTGLTWHRQLQQPLRDVLAETTHLVVCVPPMAQEPFQDPVLDVLGSLKPADLSSLAWVGYLSTIGVYGDHAGAWVDEQSDCRSLQPRSQRRLKAESGWREFAQALGVPASILRLSGIYGPGKNALEDAVSGRARVLIKPDQVFNRIHVSDLADATLLAAIAKYDGIINITDDLPAAPQDVIHYAHDLLHRTYPPAQDFESADISEMARSFYSENKRVDNSLSKSMLGMNYQFPTYKHGLDALIKTMRLADDASAPFGKFEV